jgi:hypothetical protein
MTEDLIRGAFGAGSVVNEYYSVEFATGRMPFLFQFKIWSRSTEGMFILVRRSSPVLKHLKVGQILTMRYYKKDISDLSSENSSPPVIIENLETVIRGIRSFGNRHYSIAFSILGEETPKSGVYH